MQSIRLVKGIDKDVPAQATIDGRTPSTAMLVSDTLACRVWRGDDQPTIVAPLVQWVDADTAEFKISFFTEDTADLEVGTYRIQVTAARGGRTALLLDWALELTEAPGETETEIKVYNTYQDMLLVSPFLDQFLSLWSDQTGFLEQRGMARDWLDDLVLGASSSVGGGLSPHRRALQDWNGGGSLVQSSYIKSVLDADGLMVTSRIKRIVSKYAIYLVCGSQFQPGSSKDYMEYAALQYLQASQELANTTIQLDSNGDGVAEIAVPMQITTTRAM